MVQPSRSTKGTASGIAKQKCEVPPVLHCRRVHGVLEREHGVVVQSTGQYKAGDGSSGICLSLPCLLVPLLTVCSEGSGVTASD
jgi:hypothetical protein